MAYEFKFPDVGEGIHEGKLLKWKVKVGDEVKTDQGIADVETDKAVVNIPSPVNGKVIELKNKEGDMLHLGEVFIVFESGTSTPSQKATPTPIPAKTTPVQSVSRPVSQSSDVLAMPNVRQEARKRNIDLSKLKGTGNQGQILMSDLEGGQPISLSQTTLGAVNVTVNSSLEINATPSVRQLARELGIDITTVKGSGSNGRITEDDLRNHNNTTKIYVPSSSGTPVPSATPTPVLTQDGDVRQPFTGIRSVIARRMMESLQKTAQVTHCDEAEMTKLVALREREKPRMQEKGVKLTYLPFFMKALCATVKEYPYFNAIFDEKTNEVVLRKNVDIGIATDTKNGLLVPVIRRAQEKSIVQLANDLAELSVKARDSKLSPAEMSGSSITISSVGSLGGQVFTPILNYPELAILGIGKIVKKPIVKNGKDIVIADTVTFSLSYDHRVLDGADAAKFLAKFITYVEDPEILFLEMN